MDFLTIPDRHDDVTESINKLALEYHEEMRKKCIQNVENSLKNQRIVFHRPSGLYIDTTPRNFHGYLVHWDGTIHGKKGKPLKPSKNSRRGGGYDMVISLRYNGKAKMWNISRLVGACFLGNIDGMEMNHLKRDPTLNGIFDLEISTRKENQKHWREDKESKAL